MNKQEIIKKLESIKAIGNDAIAACYNESMNAGITLMKKIDEPQKPVVPKFFDKWAKQVLEKRDKFYAISLITRAGHGYGVDYELNDNGALSGTRELMNWLVSGVGLAKGIAIDINKKKAVEALLYGYEVKKELVYAVTIPDESPVTKLSFQTEDGTQFNYDKNDPDYLALLFNDKEQADAVALLLKGKVVEK